MGWTPKVFWILYDEAFRIVGVEITKTAAEEYCKEHKGSTYYRRSSAENQLPFASRWEVAAYNAITLLEEYNVFETRKELLKEIGITAKEYNFLFFVPEKEEIK